MDWKCFWDADEGPLRRGLGCVTMPEDMNVFAGVAQLVESELPKLVVAGSNPVARSLTPDRSSGSGASDLG